MIKKAIEQSRRSPRLTEEQRVQSIMSAKLAPGGRYVHAVHESTAVSANASFQITTQRG